MNTNEIREEVRKRLTPSRYEHSEQVAQLAVRLAANEGYDKDKAEVAALLHDISREYTDKENEKAIEKYNIRLDKFSLDFKPNVHGCIGAVIAEQEFGVHDQEILDAIRNHVTGRPCMQPIEELIFIADHISKEETEAGKEEDMKIPFDQLVFMILRKVIQYDVANDKIIDCRTQMTFDWYLEKVEKHTDEEELVPDENVLRKLDHDMDEMIELYHKHRVPLEHVSNLRDLGGYETQNGRKIKKNKIFRSGNLDKFTVEDYKKLADQGINYVVDLRCESEKSPHLEKDIPGIHYVNIPFQMRAADDLFFDDIYEKYDECKDPEEAAWIIARYFLAFDMDELYIRVMTDRGTCDKIKQILHIMLSDDCNGIIFFCQSGKDRTAIVICVLMYLLGIDSKYILQDYRLSKVSYYAITLQYFETLRKRKFNKFVLDKVIDVLNIDEERVHRLNSQVLEDYSDYGSYLDQNFCFTNDEELQFKNKFLE